MQKGEKMSELMKITLSKKTKLLWRNLEYRQRMSDLHRGIKQTKITRLKKSLASMGHLVSQETREKIRDAQKEDKGHNWKGDDVGYMGIHKWIRQQLGQPTKCEHCNKDGLRGLQINWANKDHKYRRDANDWVRLCKSCHANYDIKMGFR